MRSRGDGENVWLTCVGLECRQHREPVARQEVAPRDRVQGTSGGEISRHGIHGHDGFRSRAHEHDDAARGETHAASWAKARPPPGRRRSTTPVSNKPSRVPLKVAPRYSRSSCPHDSRVPRRLTGARGSAPRASRPRAASASTTRPSPHSACSTTAGTSRSLCGATALRRSTIQAKSGPSSEGLKATDAVGAPGRPAARTRADEGRAFRDPFQVIHGHIHANRGRLARPGHGERAPSLETTEPGAPPLAGHRQGPPTELGKSRCACEPPRPVGCRPPGAFGRPRRFGSQARDSRRLEAPVEVVFESRTEPDHSCATASVAFRSPRRPRRSPGSRLRPILTPVTRRVLSEAATARIPSPLPG